MRARRVQAIAAAAVAAALLVGATGCGGSSSDGAKGSDGTTKTTSSSGSDDGGGSGDAGGSGGELPDPCELVPLEKASEILGGEAAEPEVESNDVGVESKSCSWQTQASIDNPTLDGAGHILVLQVISPPETMSMDDFWTSSKTAAGDQADIAGCDEAFWMGGLLSALKGDVYLTGTAGLADDSADAKASATDLVSTACANA